MNKFNKVHFSSNKQDWETPQEFFDELNKEFHFNLDVCANANNKKVSTYFNYEMNGLYLEWVINEKPAIVWMNPPYGRDIGEWIKKAHEESQKGCTIVALLPVRTDTKYFHDWIYKRPNVEVRFIKGRISFVGASSVAPFPSMIVIFKPPK